jgi:flagellar biogenesis protein FliO
MTGTYIQMAAALAFVILLIVGAGYLLKRKQNRYGIMNIVSYQPFGARKGIAALKVGKEVLLISVTQNDMRLLKTFNASELDLPETDGFKKSLDKFRKID